MAKRKKETPILKKIISVSLALIGLQVIFLIVFSEGSEPKTSKEALNRAIEQQRNVPANRKELMRVQAALVDYRASEGHYPASLQDLVPKYFDTVPNNPVTGKPFVYRLDGQRYVIEDVAPVKAAAATSGDDSMTAAERDALIATIGQVQEGNFVYDPSGKRDPFAPYNMAPKPREGATPLEQYSLSELKVTAILEGSGAPKAMIEDLRGRGYTVEKGTKLGPNGGEIVEIHADRIIVLEAEQDFTGEIKSRTIELFLRRPPRVH